MRKSVKDITNKFKENYIYECDICLEKVDTLLVHCITNLHPFCRKCWNSIYQTKPICPICRGNLK